MLTGATRMRLASVLVSSPKIYSEEKRQGPRRNGDKKPHPIWFSRNNEKIPTPSPRTMFESQPDIVHRTTCSSYLTYLYTRMYLYVKKGRKKISQKLPLL